MENSTHKGSEFNNIIETWNQNEKNGENAKNSPQESALNQEPQPENTLEQLIKQEAAEYDNVNKEERILGGDRATVSDDDPGTDA